MPDKIVTGYAAMWPRAIFDIKEGGQQLQRIKDSLAFSGVYILHRDDDIYYIGRTNGNLFNRIRKHATRPKAKYYNFWNFFSAFVIPDNGHISEVEGILIAVTPKSANRANPRITRIPLPPSIGKQLRNLR